MYAQCSILAVGKRKGLHWWLHISWIRRDIWSCASSWSQSICWASATLLKFCNTFGTSCYK